MSLQQSIQETYETLQNYIEDTSLVLLHPQSRLRSVLIAKLLSDPNVNAVYYAMGPYDINLPSLISGMTHDIANQHHTFGRHINMLPSSIYEDKNAFHTLVETFARDLSEVSDENFLFILDEYDRGDTADDIQRFVETLVDYIPDNCRIVLNSRTLPRLPWVALVAQGKAAILEDSVLINENFYELTTQGSDNLEVFALGPGYVLLNGQMIETWEGHLPRLLFFFVLDKPVVTRSEICQAFWPELENDQAVNVFHVTKRRLHKALAMDVLVHDDGYYRVNPELGIYYDVMSFVTTLMEGRDASLDIKQRMRAWNRVMEMYHGPFLQGHSDEWIDERRVEYQSGYLEAVTNMAKERLSQGRREHALSLYQKALVENNHRQDIHREVMRLFASMGRRAEAAAHFQDLSANIAIESETEQVYQEIMS
jgi:DNA-binding SARP family transcriptional activator